MISKKYTCLLLIILFFSLSILSLQSKSARYEYVGIDVCRKCHESASIGSQYKIWASSPHSKAYQTLLSGQAIELGKKFNIKVPSKELKCLKCHATGGGKDLKLVTEGVGCEACHGPGSGYYDFDNHASFDSRENAYTKAVRLGMYPIIGDDSIKARERLCRHCHTEKRPCITKKELQKKSEKELPLSLIADFIYSHPVR